MKTIVKKCIVLLTLLSIFILIGYTENSIETSKGTLLNKEIKKKESKYVNITYDPRILGKRAEENLGGEATKYYSETLIPSVLKRQKEIDIPKSFTEKEKALIVNYFQQNCPLEYFTGTPFFNVSGDKIIFAYPRCINMSDEEFEKLVDIMYSSIEEILNSNIKDNYNYFETVISLYRYLSKYIAYNKDADSTDAYGVFVNKEGNCNGFTQSMQILLAQLHLDEGYQVEWISRDEREGHVWNTFYIDGAWYYFDVTWENGETKGEGLEYFAMNINRRADSYLPKDEYVLAPLSLDIDLPICNNNRFNILKDCKEYKLNLDNHKIEIKNNIDNKWYILNTEDYSINKI